MPHSKLMFLMILSFTFASSSFAANPDLSSDNQLAPVTADPQITSVSIPVERVYTENDYNNLVSCPNDPSQGWQDHAPVCKDINGNLPPGQTTENCPATCKITRYVDTNVPFAKVNKVIHPTCPVGYATVATFNLAPAVVQLNKSITVPPPIIKENYETYIKAGYNCKPTSISVPVEVCRWGDGEPESWGTVTYPDNIASMPTLNEDYCYYASAGIGDCQNRVAGWPSYNQPGCTPSKIYKIKWKYQYQRMQCQITQSGSYLSDQLTTISRVCARAKATWESATPKSP